MLAEQSSKTKLRPLGNRALVIRLESDETVAGGIYLPDSAQKKQEQVRVIAVGTGTTDKNGNAVTSPVSVGNTVIMNKYAGQEIKMEDESGKEQEYIIVSWDDIVAIVE